MCRPLALVIFVEECSTIFQSHYIFCRDFVSGDIPARLSKSVFGKSELQSSTRLWQKVSRFCIFLSNKAIFFEKNLALKSILRRILNLGNS